MKERPILFSAPMIRALLSGTKTQTRRVMKAVKHPDFGNLYEPSCMAREEQHAIERACPYGQPGDRLWVREAHGYVSADKYGPVWDSTIYRADDNEGWTGKWRPSIHMPRAASRITLEVTRVRVERLQDISEQDAKAEGCARLDAELYDHDATICQNCGGTRLFTAFSSRGALPDTDCLECDTYAKRFRHLWESINGPGSWDANPWLWVVEFKRVEQGQ